jgi:hypothetical protein
MQYWLSISSHREGFIGVIIVEAESEQHALKKAYEVSPGTIERACQVKGCMIENHEEKWLNRLIVKPEIDEIGDSIYQNPITGERSDDPRSGTSKISRSETNP